MAGCRSCPQSVNNQPAFLEFDPYPNYDRRCNDSRPEALKICPPRANLQCKPWYEIEAPPHPFQPLYPPDLPFHLYRGAVIRLVEELYHRLHHRRLVIIEVDLSCRSLHEVAIDSSGKRFGLGEDNITVDIEDSAVAFDCEIAVFARLEEPEIEISSCREKIRGKSRSLRWQQTRGIVRGGCHSPVEYGSV